MRKIVICLLALLLTGNILLAQEDSKRSREERIKAIKVAFITEELGLTTEQSQSFWPLYNELEAKVKTIKKASRTRKGDLETLSDLELEQKMESILQAEEKVIATKRAYITKFKEIISIQQIAKLMGLEKQFKKELLKHIREQRGEGRGRRGGR